MSGARPPPESPPQPHREPHVALNLHPESTALPERLQAAIHHIRTLEARNTKLFQDNSRLVNAVNVLTDRLALLGAPQNTLALRLAGMQDRLRASDENAVSIHRKYQELLQCISAGSAHQHIFTELQAARDAYASLNKEYCLLRDKYTRLRALADTGRAAQQQSQAPTQGFIPVGHPEFCVRGQTLNNSPSLTSAIPPGSYQPLPDQDGNHRRRSSGGVVAQPSLRPGPASSPTTWLAPLPTPPPSASLPAGRISPTGVPVHAPVPAASLPPPPPPQVIHGPSTSPGLPSVIQSCHLADPGASEQLESAVHLRQRRQETTDATAEEPPQPDQQISAPVSLGSSPRAPKRPDSELQTSASPRMHKKPRTEGEAVHSSGVGTDTHPVTKTPSGDSPAPTQPHQDLDPSGPGSDVPSHRDCVNLIFEKDADVENGIFCGLCFDRYEAKMIPEPPDILVQPDFDFLVTHCMTMHPTAWEDLHRRT